jgi:hypothetical protein
MSDLSLLYKIREALGFDHLYPLSHLDIDAAQMRKALIACTPIAFAAIDEEKKDEIGNSDLDNDQPVTLMIRTTLGQVREARRALFIANVHAPIPTAKWGCMGRKQFLPEPGECNWPDCGCDPHATKVIESLLEQGWTQPQSTSTLKTAQGEQK